MTSPVDPVDERYTDEQFSLPGAVRAELVKSWATGLSVADERPAPEWELLQVHDQVCGLGSRLAARAVLVRPDGRMQYSPVFVGEIDGELPDVGGQEYFWLAADDVAKQVPDPRATPLASYLRQGLPATPTAVFLPA